MFRSEPARAGHEPAVAHQPEVGNAGRRPRLVRLVRLNGDRGAEVRLELERRAPGADTDVQRALADLARSRITCAEADRAVDAIPERRFEKPDADHPRGLDGGDLPLERHTEGARVGRLEAPVVAGPVHQLEFEEPRRREPGHLVPLHVDRAHRRGRELQPAELQALDLAAQPVAVPEHHQVGVGRQRRTGRRRDTRGQQRHPGDPGEARADRGGRGPQHPVHATTALVREGGRQGTRSPWRPPASS